MALLIPRSVTTGSNVASSSGSLLIPRSATSSAQPASQKILPQSKALAQKPASSGYTIIGNKSYPTASIVKSSPKPTNIFQSAWQTYTNIRDAVDKKISGKIGLKKDEGLGAPLGRVLQKTPNVDLGTKGQKTFQATDTETKIVNFISNFPSAVAQALGYDLQMLSTPDGKKQLKEGGKNLPKTMNEVKTHIDNREWGKAFETAMANPALVVGLDVASFIPIGLIPKALKSSLGLRKTAQTVVKEAIEEVLVKPVA